MILILIEILSYFKDLSGKFQFAEHTGNKKITPDRDCNYLHIHVAAKYIVNDADFQVK